jgi:hypothetical protein
MTGTIFSNLPNNLIMNIIKMAEDERKKEEKESHQKKFIDVMNQFNEMFLKIKRFYLSHDYDEMFLESEMSIDEKLDIIISDHSRDMEMYDCSFFEYIFLCNVFTEIEDINEQYEWEEERHEAELMDDPEYRYETRYDNNEGNEWDYDWGDLHEPSWACE